MSALCTTFQSRIVTRLQDAAELLATSSVIVRAESRDFGKDEVEEFLNGADADCVGVLVVVMLPEVTRVQNHRVEIRSEVLIIENPSLNTTSPTVHAEECAMLVFALLEKLQPPNRTSPDYFTPLMPQGVNAEIVTAAMEQWVVEVVSTTGIGILDAVYWVTGAGAPIIGTIAEMVAYSGATAGTGYLLADSGTPEAQGLWFYVANQDQTEDGVDVINADDGGQFRCLSHFACVIS